MKKRIGIGFLFLVLLCGCRRYDRTDTATMPAPVVVRPGESEESEEETESMMTVAASEPETQEEAPEPVRVPTKVKGIYLSAYVAGTESMINNIIEQIDQTEINAVVIDVKDDNGRITFGMNTPMVQEIGRASCRERV